MSPNNDNHSEDDHILVVGLGASAGGLDPLRKFFNSLPAESGMAFIVVQHLPPDKESSLSEILQRETELKVLQVKEKTKIRRDHIYVIPPNKLLSVENHHLELSEPQKKHGSASIDLLFRTLAKRKQKYAAGILFSGTGSDGITGMKIIKEQGGITIAQDPDEAQHPSMPVNAINTGAVDKILPVKDMAEELRQYHKSFSDVKLPEGAEELSGSEETEDALAKIFDRIRSRNDHDFSNYRRSSVLRRISRRLRVTRVKNLSEYLAFIDENPDEIDELHKDLLISVTNFFRDTGAFKTLADEIIPKLYEGKDRSKQIRVWVPGCATGEEAYSLAILLQEYATELESRPEIQIFASDVDQDALDVARAGRYPKSIENDVSSKRLHRYFLENGDEYIIKGELRDMILFASHDLLRNPPFSKLDLISCRNLLIYLNRDLQSEVFNLFHYALRDNGWLFLGKSDARIGAEALFDSVSKEYRIYQKQAHIHSRSLLPVMPLLYKTDPVVSYKKKSIQQKNNLEKMHWSLLAGLYAPESVLISKDYEVIHSTDGIKKYLEYPGGEPSRNILDMVKPEIRQELRNILFQLKSKDSTLVQKVVRTDEGGEKLELIARTFTEKDFPKGLIHIVFKEVAEVPEKEQVKRKSSDLENTDGDTEIIEALENDLEYTRQQLQLSVEEYETSNEELRASNEELQSMNEELQSTAEELETSKEELQSLNEELKTVNDQLESKIEELSHAHSDLENLMEATEVGIIFVDRNFCVQRFTSTSTEIFNLISSDKGRPLQHITHSLDYDELITDIGKVRDNLEKIKKVISTKDGRWFILRMRPYRSSEDKIEGVVLSFTEFTELKEARETIKVQSFQETLATLGLYALEQEDLSMIMHRAIQQSCAILNLECAAILLLSDDGKTFDVASEAGCGCKDLDIEIENDKNWDLGYTLTSQKPVSVVDYNKEDRFQISPCMTNRDFMSSAQIAIRGTEQVFGIFAVYSTDKREFSTQELHFIQVVANIIGRSIEQKKDQKELKQTNTRLQNEMKRSEQFQKEIINNSVLERWELGGYLHDSFGQLLASVKILADDIRFKVSDSEIDLADEVKEINRIIDMCMRGVRDVIHNIIPVDIENEGVAQAFRLLMRQTFKLHDVNCILESSEVLEDIKNREAATHLYHIVQEAFKNAAVHGEADNILVSVDAEDNHFILQIKDDGVGLKSTKNSDGKGIRIMKHRMDLLGGTFSIDEHSDDNMSGTVVTCTLPMENLKRPESRE